MNGKNYLIPDKILYSLAESFKQENWFLIDLFALSSPFEETKQTERFPYRKKGLSADK